MHSVRAGTFGRRDCRPRARAIAGREEARVGVVVACDGLARRFRQGVPAGDRRQQLVSWQAQCVVAKGGAAARRGAAPSHRRVRSFFRHSSILASDIKTVFSTRGSFSLPPVGAILISGSTVVGSAQGWEVSWACCPGPFKKWSVFLPISAYYRVLNGAYYRLAPPGPPDFPEKLGVPPGGQGRSTITPFLSGREREKERERERERERVATKE